MESLKLIQIAKDFWKIISFSKLNVHLLICFYFFDLFFRTSSTSYRQLVLISDLSNKLLSAFLLDHRLPHFIEDVRDDQALMVRLMT